MDPCTWGEWERTGHVGWQRYRDLLATIIPVSSTLSERMAKLRRANGWSIAEAAKKLGVHHSSWRKWERLGHVPLKKYRALLDGFLANEGSR